MPKCNSSGDNMYIRFSEPINKLDVWKITSRLTIYEKLFHKKPICGGRFYGRR